MSEREILIGHIRALMEELARILADPRYDSKRQSRQRGLELYTQSLERIDRLHIAFLEHRAELVERCAQFGRDLPRGR